MRLRVLKGRLRGIWKALSGPRVPLHRRENHRPFFIVGSGRSGTTLLRRFLSGDRTHISPEIWATGPVVQDFLESQLLAGWEAIVKHSVTELLAQSEFRKEFRHQVFEIIERLEAVGPGKRSLALLIDQVHREHAAWIGKDGVDRWGDKTPLNAFYLSEIDLVFPDARYLHMIRDGVDVVSSYVAADLQPHLLAAADRWIRSVSAVENYVEEHPTRVLEVRYEDLVHEPVGETRRVCRFLDLPFEEEMIEPPDPESVGDLVQRDHHRNVLEPVTTDSVGKGRRSLGTAERDRLAPVLNPHLRRLGYDPL